MPRGVIESIKHHSDRAWNGKTFHNYNCTITVENDPLLKGKIAFMDNEPVYQIGNVIEFEIEDSQYGKQFKKHKLVSAPVPAGEIPFGDAPAKPAEAPKKTVQPVRVETSGNKRIAALQCAAIVYQGTATSGTAMLELADRMVEWIEKG